MVWPARHHESDGQVVPRRRRKYHRRREPPADRKWKGDDQKGGGAIGCALCIASALCDLWERYVEDEYMAPIVEGVRNNVVQQLEELEGEDRVAVQHAIDKINEAFHASSK